LLDERDVRQSDEPEGLEGAIRGQEEDGETALQLQRADHDGHPAESGEAAHPERHLRVHNAPLSLLREQQAGLAEFHPAQSLPQQVLRQGAPPLRRSGQGQLLDAGPELRGCFHRWYHRQAATQDHSRLEIPIGGLQEEHGAHRDLSALRTGLADLALHPAVSSPRHRVLPRGDRFLRHTRRLSGQSATWSGDHVGRESTLQTAAAAGDGSAAGTRCLLRRETAADPHGLSHRHRDPRDPGTPGKPLRVLQHPEIARASATGGGVQPATQVPPRPGAGVEPTGFQHGFARQQSRADGPAFAPGHRLQRRPADETATSPGTPPEAHHGPDRPAELNRSDLTIRDLATERVQEARRCRARRPLVGLLKLSLRTAGLDNCWKEKNAEAGLAGLNFAVSLHGILGPLSSEML